MMQRRGVTKETVLARGDVLFLRGTGNLSTGGTAIDLTDVVHPDNRDMAVRAAKAIGLDVCGVDFISPDITQSYRDVGGGARRGRGGSGITAICGCASAGKADPGR